LRHRVEHGIPVNRWTQARFAHTILPVLNLQPNQKNTMTQVLKSRLAFLVLTSLLCALGTTAMAEKRHGIAMHGDLKYPPGFRHFDYVNPNAPKGGTLRLGVVADNFDSFNPFIIKGVDAEGVGYLYQTLTSHAADEASSEYGLIAESIEVADDRSAVTFHLDPGARFSDGQPITAEDVVYSFNTLTRHERAHPYYASYYGDVASVEARDQHTVHFSFKTTENRELPLILGQLPVLAKHYWEANDFGSADLKIPVGNGPYRIKSFEPGRSVTYVRDQNYWAKDHPVNLGRYNFDEIRYEYYKDNTIALEAFKAGEYDFRIEMTARNWANSYTGPKFDSGELIKEEVRHQRPAGLQAFLFNTRRPQFKDPKVRQALGYAFDFEWSNQNLFNGQYTRSDSYFENSELASSGLPSKEELAILEPLRPQLPPEVFTQAFAVPKTDGSGNIRASLRQATKLLKEAGWTIRDGRLTDAAGKAMEFEFLTVQKDFERVVLPFIKNLEKLGVKASIRLIDTSQYINRLREFDFDIIVSGFGQSESPGNEQREYWLSSRADMTGSRNLIGVRDPVVDQLVELVISAPDRQSLIHRTRALDRVLLWGHYVIPNWFNPVDRVAYSRKLAHPDVTPKSGVVVDAWWMKPAQ
jgi:microcin C transport system substrate-binding protein